MAIRETIQIGNPLLKSINQEIRDFKSKKIKQVIQDLIDTMRENDLVGMAAPQIGEKFKIFITEPRVTEARSNIDADEIRIYINPTIKDSSKEEVIIYEGCGSVLGGLLFGPVKRAKTILIEAYDLNGKKFQFKCDGLLARIIQHEYDHINGIEFTEKVYDYSKLMERTFYILNIRNSEEQIKNSKTTIKEFKQL